MNVLKEYNISVDNCMFTKNSAANMRATVINELKVRWVPCMAHSLHNLLLTSFNQIMSVNITIRDLINKVFLLSKSLRLNSRM